MVAPVVNARGKLGSVLGLVGMTVRGQRPSERCVRSGASWGQRMPRGGIPAFAGMTWEGAGMGLEGAGVTWVRVGLAFMGVTWVRVGLAFMGVTWVRVGLAFMGVT